MDRPRLTHNPVTPDVAGHPCCYDDLLRLLAITIQFSTTTPASISTITFIAFATTATTAPTMTTNATVFA
eukprot:7194851-Pyramimonas_sp.AAC.1